MLMKEKTGAVRSLQERCAREENFLQECNTCVKLLTEIKVHRSLKEPLLHISLYENLRKHAYFCIRFPTVVL